MADPKTETEQPQGQQPQGQQPMEYVDKYQQSISREDWKACEPTCPPLVGEGAGPETPEAREERERRGGPEPAPLWPREGQQGTMVAGSGQIQHAQASSQPQTLRPGQTAEAEQQQAEPQRQAEHRAGEERARTETRSSLSRERERSR